MPFQGQWGCSAVETVVPVAPLVKKGGMGRCCCWEMAKLEEILVVFVEPPEEGEAVLVPDFPLEHHNASLKVAAHPVWCLPPVQVMEDQEVLGAIH